MCQDAIIYPYREMEEIYVVLTHLIHKICPPVPPVHILKMRIRWKHLCFDPLGGIQHAKSTHECKKTSTERSKK